MKVKQVTIPSAFIKLDDQITAADEIVNVHDQHVFRQNHNALLAQRVRKDLIAQASPGSRSSTTAPSANHVYFKTRFSPDGEAHARIISVPIYVTQLTKEIEFWCYACQSTLDGESTLDEDPLLYITPREPNLDYMGDIANNTITVSAANGTPTKYTATVSLPPRSGEHTLHFGREPWILDVHLRGFIDNTRVDWGPGALSDVGNNWFVIASSTPGIHDVVYSSNVRIEPRSTVHGISVGGGNYKYFIDRPWTEMPIPGTDTLSTREVLGVDLYSWGVQELAITDFSEDHAI